MHRGDGVPIVVGHLVDQVVAGDAGIVDQDIERAEPPRDLFDHGFDLGDLGHIDLEPDRLDTVRCGNPSGGLGPNSMGLHIAGHGDFAKAADSLEIKAEQA